MAFDWQNSSVEEAAEHMLKSSFQAVARAMKYYTERGNIEVCEKITNARTKAKKARMIKKLEGM